MNSDAFVEATTRLDSATSSLRLLGGEELRARKIGNQWRAYWVLEQPGYSHIHGGRTLSLLWRSVRDDDGKIVSASTTQELESLVIAMHQESTLAVPDFGEVY